MKQRAGAKARAAREPMKLDAYERALLVYLPALVLLVAFVAVCVQAGTPWPWNRVVHEDGQHTFLGTIFYFEHATRELLLDAALALAVAGGVRYFYPPSRTGGGRDLARTRIMLGVGTAAALALILGGTAYVNAFGPYYSAEARGARSRLHTWPIYAAATVAVACGVFVLIASVIFKAQTYGQTTSLAALLFPHFFEHSLGYGFTSALAGFLYLLPTRKSGITS